MLPAKPKLPNYEQIISDLLCPAAGPVPVAALTAQMLAVRPSAAKDPQKGARQHVVDAVGRQLVFLDADTVLPLRLAYQGARFRLPLDAKTVRQGRLPLDHSLTAYLPDSFDLTQVQFVDAAGRRIVHTHNAAGRVALPAALVVKAAYNRVSQSNVGQRVTTEGDDAGQPVKRIPAHHPCRVLIPALQPPPHPLAHFGPDSHMDLGPLWQIQPLAQLQIALRVSRWQIRESSHCTPHPRPA